MEDTPDLLGHIEQLNIDIILPNNAVLVTTDVIGLFTDIPQEDGAKAAEEALEEIDNKEVPSHFLTKRLNLILEYNIFEYDSKLYRQLIGTSMGSEPAPDYSNNFMARRIDPHIKTIARKYTEGNIPLLLLKLF